jgi:hypothetical protein
VDPLLHGITVFAGTLDRYFVPACRDAHIEPFLDEAKGFVIVPGDCLKRLPFEGNRFQDSLLP